MNILHSLDRIKKAALSQNLPEDDGQIRPVDLDDKVSRREFLGLGRSKCDGSSGTVKIDTSRCTGCSLCALDCPSQALIFERKDDEDSYRILFQQGRCDGCGLCRKSCPEQCLRVEQGPDPDNVEEKLAVLFEDKLCACRQCGIPLFPRAMMNHLRSKMSTAGNAHLALDLCPACRLKSPLAGIPQAETNKQAP